jgi:hypothetical protein
MPPRDESRALVPVDSRTALIEHFRDMTPACDDRHRSSGGRRQSCNSARWCSTTTCRGTHSGLSSASVAVTATARSTMSSSSTSSTKETKQTGESMSYSLRNSTSSAASSVPLMKCWASIESGVDFRKAACVGNLPAVPFGRARSMSAFKQLQAEMEESIQGQVWTTLAKC